MALAKLNHQNIAAVYDVGTTDDVDYLVMEYVPGQSLVETLRSRSLQPGEALRLCEEIANALQEAHDQGIIHRDLKPANIIVTPKGHAKVLDFGLDFGLAKLFSTNGDGTETLLFPETKGVAGTPLYMSPEQAEGRAVDSRTDIWSLGIVLYESLAGRPPFSGDGLAVMRSIALEQPKPLRELRPATPGDAVQIVNRIFQILSSRREGSLAGLEIMAPTTWQAMQESGSRMVQTKTETSFLAVPGIRRLIFTQNRKRSRLSIGPRKTDFAAFRTPVRFRRN